MENSIWTEGVRLPEFPALERDLKTDVLIIGGGLAGVLCAWKLGQAGVEYALIEADRICHGVSRNTTAKVTAHHGLIYHKLLKRFGEETARQYWKVNSRALEEYRKLADSVDCDLETRDNYIYTLDDTSVLERELEALRRLGIPGEFTTETGLPFPVAGAIRVSEQGQFHPLKLVAHLAKGLRIYENTAAKEFKGNTVVTDRGEITAGKVIVATHFPILNKHGGYFLKLYQQRSYVLALENAPDLGGMYLDGTGDGLSFRNVGDLLLIGGGGHRTGHRGDGWEPLEEAARRYFLEGREKCRWATQDCMSLDGMPYIGRYSPRTPNLYVTTGYNKWGMTTAMASAGILCDMVLGRKKAGNEIFLPSRSILRPQLFANAGESVLHILKPTSPRCPHLGCALKWDPGQRVWECPCHGSRFDADGKLLDGPATGDLESHTGFPGE